MDESEREEFDWMEESLEDSLDSHKAFIVKFKRILWPFYQNQGLSLGEALILYKLCNINNTISEANSPPNEDWETNAEH